MFKRSFRSQDQNRVDKTARLKKQAAARDHNTKLSKLQRSLTEQDVYASRKASSSSATPSPIVTITVGREGRLFAAHEDVLRQSPFFEAACRGGHFPDAQSRRISLPDEEPEVFSAVLEYLYKGDYYPRLLHDRQRNSWDLEDRQSRTTPQASPNLDRHHHTGGGRAPEATVYLFSAGAEVLRDTVIYCAAERYGLEELKRLALRKQGLQAGIDVGTILRSAQYAYAHTPDSDSRLRAHYLALIIRCRKTFKRSGTMQAEMEAGGSKLFFDLFVAMCNHLDDVIDVSAARTPKTV
ncbi:BTB/POZ-like protein [Purpureocillium lavendulum]|uniref:BTB/POZ-like protein n=1 Tax=Purpureocillium lavendulum TaxID=1247861 RepID=A0AB34G3J9_9HYPO|nr:BTB/POZ-like protein [Purpureocillium lavendulum]